MIRRGEPGATSRQGLAAAIVVALVVIVLGGGGSVFAGRAVARSDAQKSQRESAASSADITSRLSLAIRQEQDLVIDARAFMVAGRSTSSAEFHRWIHADRVFERHPEIVGLVRIVLVPAAKLSSFAKRAPGVVAGAVGAAGSFHVVPPGARPFYCFIDLNGSPSTQIRAASPPGLDLCVGDGGSRLIAARNSGQGSYVPLQLAKVKALGISTPIYRGGITPATVAGRQAAFMGWIGEAIVPKVALAIALEHHPDAAVAFRYDHGGSRATFSGGAAPPDARRLSVDLHNGWTVETAVGSREAGLFVDRSALLVMIGGIAISVLLALLGFVLATGRARALRLVSEQTFELRDQATELRGTVGELEAAQAIKDEFLGLVSHELRTPLTSIRGFAEILQEEDLPSDQRGYVEVIDRNTERLQGLVEDLLLMAQIQSGQLPLRLGVVALSELVASSGEAAQPFAVSKEIDLHIAAEPGIATEGDAARLGQVIDNLVSNAIKYTPNGGEVGVTMTRTGKTATISINDSGIGIPKAEQDQMFQRFFRGSNAQVAEIKGTGLGLAVTRGLVEAHGGTISFDSVEGAGSTFRVTLPLVGPASLASAA